MPRGRRAIKADTPKTTPLGNTFIAPAGWSVSTRGPATIVEAPEGDLRRKLQEVLFDGRPEADADLAAAAKSLFAQIAAERKTLVVPADAQDAAPLAAHYRNAALGGLEVQRSGTKTRFDFGEWQSEVASRRNPDGTTSFITLSPGVSGFEFVVGAGDKKTLTTRDAQHEYVFDAV